MNTSNKSLKEIIDKLMISEYVNDYSLLSNIIKPAIGIRHSQQKKISKLGGNPFFPPNFDMCDYVDESLIFLCQISVEEYRLYDEYNYLPSDSILYFYVNKVKLNSSTFR